MADSVVEHGATPLSAHGVRQRLTVSALGAVTIAAYGAAYYAYGVLLGPIATSTGWSSSQLGAVFSAVLLATGVIGVLGGRLLDRFGPRPLFLVAGTAGCGLLAAAPLAPGFASFAVLYGSACGLIGGLGFYHVTQPVAARTRPADPARAIVALTIIGAFCSPIYLPATAWLVGRLGWQGAVEVHAAVAAAAFLVAAAVIPSSVRQSASAVPPQRSLEVLRDGLRSGAMRRWLIATAVSGAASDVLLVFSVPAMTAAGLSLGLAASIAGLRGLAQILGRLPLNPVLRRLGARAAIVGAYLLAALGSVVLIAGGQPVFALAYVVLAGASLGSLSALQGIYTHELVAERNLGILFGAQQALAALAGAAGPLLAGVVLDRTASFPLVLAMVAMAFVGAAGALGPPFRGRGPA